MSVNWLKTIYFNFKMLPFNVAKKMPVFFYGPVKFTSLKGVVSIDEDVVVQMGMIGFGQSYELNKAYIGISEITIDGTVVFKGYCQFGKDYFLHVDKQAECFFGNMSSLGSRGKIICKESIFFGNYARFGSECQVIDTNFHDMMDLESGELYPKTKPIRIGDFNFISNRVSVMKGTVTPDYCSIGLNSLCNKDYTSYGNNILIGGVPSKLLKENISRDWIGENKRLERYLVIQNKFRGTA